jgi:hypothetical protein
VPGASSAVRRNPAVAALAVVGAALALACSPAVAAWQATAIPAPQVTAVEQSGAETFVATGKTWYRFDPATLRLEPSAGPKRLVAPSGALPDARVATGRETVGRAWLSEPTSRYAHGVLGDAIEAGSLSIVRRDGTQAVLRLGTEAVFEDIAPRVAQVAGREQIVLIKAYLDRGAALAVVDPVSATIVAESTPIGHANAWRNPAGIADYDGDGTTDIAAVRQPHVVGRLELWSFDKGRLRKTVEVSDTCNHVIGSRALALSATADFDKDGRPDLAIPSFDRRALRLIAFAPAVRDIARVAVPSRIVTDFAMVQVRGRPALLVGLEDGQLVLVRERP